MKYLIIVYIVFSCLPSFSQHSKVMMESISKNDLTLAEESLSNFVLLSINDSTTTLQKSNAISQLSTYLNLIQPTGYQKRHSGQTITTIQHYVVANLTSIEGKHRLFVYTENKNGLVKEIRLTAIQ